MESQYEKRKGTTGMGGQLYEINLVSLILLRLQHDKQVEVLYLASNMDKIGSFDDVCFRINITGSTRPILVFIQAKHKENEDRCLTYDLIKNFHESYIKVRENFQSKDVFFKGKFEEIDCVFILYTNAKYFNEDNNVQGNTLVKQSKKIYKSSFSDKLNEIIATGDEDCNGYQTAYSDEDLKIVNATILEEEIATLAELFAKFLNDKSSMNIMLDKYVLRYHVLIAKHFVDITEVKFDEKKTKQWREMTFKPNFFNDDVIVRMFRTKLCEQIVKIREDSSKQKSDQIAFNFDEETVDKLIMSFLNQPSALTLCPLIDNHVIYEKGVLKFKTERPNDDVLKLGQIVIIQTTVDQAIKLKKKFTQIFKVPVTFGNLDLTLGGNANKIEKRLNTLTDFIADLCQKSEIIDAYAFVVIDECAGEGFFSLNNGIGSAVGNLLVYDHATKLLKFTEDTALLPNNAKTFFGKLNTKIDNINSYRFDAKNVMTFPKLVFDYSDDARVLLNKVIVYENQSNHVGIETIFKKEIENHLKEHKSQNFPVKSDIVAMHYQNIVQKWWMSSKMGTYFTKAVNKIKETVNNIIKEPQLISLHTTFCMNNVNYLRYNVIDPAVESLASLKNILQCIIVTDILTLTTIKVTQCFKHSNNYIFLNLECMLNLSKNDFAALINEIQLTENLLILFCDTVKKTRTFSRRLDDLAEATEEKKIIIITNEQFFETLQEYFQTAQILNDPCLSLNDFTLDSQKIILENAIVNFQGQDINSSLLIDDVAKTFIKGAILKKIIHSETITIGKSLSNAIYENIKHMYIDRRVIRAAVIEDNSQNSVENVTGIQKKDICLIKTFYDIKDDVVLIAAKPGMGKSTLLTHLSVTTKEVDQMLWIVRLNLLDHSKVFYDWTVNKTSLDILETLKFICSAILNNNAKSINLKKIDHKVHLDDTSDESFELKIFLHFFNERNILFVFDGFDEICPFYKETFISFLNVVKCYPRKHKMWVTSRPYSEILPDLEKALGKAFVLDYVNEIEQEVYLKKYWNDLLEHVFLSQGLLESFTYQMHNLLLARLSSWNNQDAVYISLDGIYKHLSKYVHSIKSEYFDDFDQEEDSAEKPSTSSHEVNQVSPIKSVDQFLGTPLLLFLLGDYFGNIIVEYSKTEKWPVSDVNISNIYEGFIETKLKKILFQDKNKMDVYKPDIMTKYEKELKDCYDMHKKLAAHFMLKNTLFHDECRLVEFRDISPFNETDSAEFEDMINKFKSGTEKTGLISYVTVDNIPVFIHRTFAEYFAAEYICDIIKNKKIEDNGKKLLFYTIYLFNTNDVFPWVSRKRDIDEDLASILENIKCLDSIVARCRPKFLFTDIWRIEHIIRIMSSSPYEDYDNDYMYVMQNKFACLKKSDDGSDEVRTLIYEFHFNLYDNMKPYLKEQMNSRHAWVWLSEEQQDIAATCPLRVHLNNILNFNVPFPIGHWNQHITSLINTLKPGSPNPKKTASVKRLVPVVKTPDGWVIHKPNSLDELNLLMEKHSLPVRYVILMTKDSNDPDRTIHMLVETRIDGSRPNPPIAKEQSYVTIDDGITKKYFLITDETVVIRKTDAGREVLVFKSNTADNGSQSDQVASTSQTETAAICESASNSSQKAVICDELASNSCKTDVICDESDSNMSQTTAICDEPAGINSQTAAICNDEPAGNNSQIPAICNEPTDISSQTTDICNEPAGNSSQTEAIFNDPAGKSS